MRWTAEEYARFLRHGPGGQVSEAAFLSAVLRLARSAGFLAYHTYRSTKSAEGFPDVVLAPGPTIVTAGHPLYAVELKTNTGQLTKPQEAWLEAIAGSTGVVSAVWRPDMLQEIIAVLRQ